MTTEAPASPAPSVQLRRHHGFLHFVSSRMASSIAFQGAGVAIGWLIYAKTNNPFDLGLVGLFQFLPMLILTLPAGHVADQFDRRFIGLACQVVEALVLLAMALLEWNGALSPALIFVGVAILGSAQAFERPTMAALLPAIIPPGVLQRAMASSTSFMQTALILGPSIGGLLYGVGTIVPFIVSALLFGVASYNVLRIERPTRTITREPPTLKSVFAGIAFVRSNPVILGTISLDLFAVLLGGATALLPIYASDILAAGPVGLGFLRAAPAIGAVAMSVVLTRWPLRHNVGLKMFAAVTVFGIATLVFGLSTNVLLSIVAFLVLGAADSVSVVIRHSLVQLMTPDEMRGRVSAVNALFIGTSNQLGEFESGTLAGLVGPVAACVIGGVGTLAIVALWAWKFPALRKVDSLSG